MKIIIYIDTPFSAGHEKMMITIIRQLLEMPEYFISVIYYQNNQFLKEELEAIDSDKLNCIRVGCCSRKSPLLKLLLEWNSIGYLVKIFRSQHADISVVCAGGIELCLKGLIASKIAKIPVIEYIPITHKASFMGSRYGVFKDIIQQYFYYLPSYYITITQSLKDMICERGVSSERVLVVKNGIGFEGLEAVDRMEARLKLGISHTGYIFGLIGRIEFLMKKQDWLLGIFEKNDNIIKGSSVLFVGDGPDKEKLIQSIEKSALKDRLYISDWQKNMSVIYSAIDCLVIPSRFEGFPLVMLEAIYFNRPVLARRVDGMKDFLPDDWLFDNEKEMLDKISRLFIEDQADLIRRYRDRIIRDYNASRMGGDFSNAIKNIFKQRHQLA